MNEIVEQVARAICRAGCVDVHPTIRLAAPCKMEGAMCSEWTVCLPEAMAAIAALRMPTGRMLLSARGYAGDNRLDVWDTSIGHHPNDIPFYEGLWQAMIDAAFKE